MNDEHKSYFMRKKRWTEQEKRILLRALKKHGSQNVHKLKFYLPNKSTHSIAQMIRKYQTIAEMGKKEVCSPLDVWLRSGIFSKENTMAAEALLFIYLFEDHPSPQETAGFDIRYRLLSIVKDTYYRLHDFIYKSMYSCLGKLINSYTKLQKDNQCLIYQEKQQKC